MRRRREQQARTEAVKVRLTLEDKARYEREAEELEDSLAGYLHLKIKSLEGAFVFFEVDRAELDGLRRQINLLGTNFNQIARAINFFKKADKEWHLNRDYFLMLTRRLEVALDRVDRLLDDAHVPARRERRQG